MGTQKNHLNETVLLSIHNLWQNWWIRKYSHFYSNFFFVFCLSSLLSGKIGVILWYVWPKRHFPQLEMLDIMINFLDFYPQYFIFCRQTLYESIHWKTCFLLYHVKNSSTDQTALIGILISAINFHFHIVYILAKVNILWENLFCLYLKNNGTDLYSC